MKIFLKPVLGLCLMMGLLFSCKKNALNTEEPAISSSPNSDTIVHKLIINGNLTLVKQIKDEFYFADDILLSKEQFNSLKAMTLPNVGTERSLIIKDFVKTWPDAKVYYSYPDPALMTTTEYNYFVATIDQALTAITDSTNIQFIKRTTEPEYLKFVKHPTTNSSPLGWAKGVVNTVKISAFRSPANIIHEVLHSLGVQHEQCRADRDQYITVYPSRIIPGELYNFNIASGFVDYGPFDFESVMIYYSQAFAIDYSLPSMTKLNGDTFPPAFKLSSGDVSGLKHLYSLN